MARDERLLLSAIVLTLAGLILLPAGCSSRPPRAVAIGEAYVGPAELKIRADLPMESATVAVVHHGDRLEILQQRRSVFLRVRTPKGAEGWTDARQLLASGDMAALRDLAARAAHMQSQGVASTYAELRVHTEPAPDSPSFLTIKENEKFDVLGSQTLPRVSTPRAPLVPAPPKKKKAPAQFKTSKAEKIPPPPMPKPPGAPPNWLELSGAGEDQAQAENPLPEPAATPAPTDNWSLVRTSGGQAGWVLTRRLYMAIPDEVAQYAEGHRIVSYFPLGEVRDGDQTRQQWLWTTIAGPAGTYDFDSFRVFVWSLKHHRYETAYIERNIRGHSPVLLDTVEVSTGTRKAPAQTAYQGFSICLEKADGQRRLQDFAFLNPTVRFAGERDCPATEALQTVRTAASAPAPSANAAPSEPLSERIGKTWRELTKRWFAH